MSDNTQITAGAGGDVIRTEDRSGIKTQIVGLDLNPAGSESLMAGTLPVIEGGTYVYDAGTAAGTVDVPADALLKRVSVVADPEGTGATVTIGGGDTITIGAGGDFDEQIPGRALGKDVVIGGDVSAYYVSWVTV